MEYSTACLDWQGRIRAKKSLISCKPMYPNAAKEALAVFNALRVVDVAGSPTMGEISRPWVTDFVASIFGAYDGDSGRQMVKEFFMLISKKNSKSTTAAGIMLTALIQNWRSSAEYLILAPTVEVANNSFYPARDMVRADAELSDLFLVQEHVRTITHRVNGSTLKVVAADNETVSGKKATAVLIDELWLFGKKSGAENMLREACGGLASRPEGFVIYLSTQSDEAPAGVFKDKLLYARKVRDGAVKDDKFLPVLYEFPPEMLKANEHRDPANYYITNPNLGASVDEEYLVREGQKAAETSQESLQGFEAKHLNVEVGIALQSNRWAGADYWDTCTEQVKTLDELLARSDVADVGIDGGGLDDLLGLAVIGRDAETRKWLHWGHAWAHETVLARRKSEVSKLRDFEADGDLSIVSQVGHDVEALAEYVAQVERSGLLDKIGVDPYGLGGVIDALEQAGVPQEKVIAVPQGWKMVGAIKTTERKLAEGAFIHGGSRMMGWCVGNAKVEPKGNAIAITKQTAGTAKIDPLMALFNAASLMAVNPISTRSFWESHEAA